METASQQQTTQAPQNVAWYHAATLTERLASWSPTETSHILDELDTTGEAEKILRRWKAQKPFDSGTFFADRLAMDNLTEQDLLALLAEPVEELKKRLSAPSEPDWVTELTCALSGPPPSPLLAQDREHFTQQFAMIQPLYPLLQTSIERLQTGIDAFSQQDDPPPFDPQTLLSLLLPSLFRQIGQRVHKTLVLELNIARLRGLLKGETPQERFQDYLRQLSQHEQRQSLLEEYSVLARQILQCSQLWAACSLEFVQRLCADWQDILSAFHPSEEPGELCEVIGDASDTHRGGHHVMLLTFRSGWQLVYKPKSLTIDTHFQALLAWLNARGAHPAFRLLTVIDRGTYGWSEFVTPSSCHNQAEVARFYQRQGGYLALLYILEATDFHHENIIADGEDPILVDLEALFHHRQSRREDTLPGLAQLSLEHSVMRSLFLPSRLFLNQEGEGIDISGLSQAEGQLTPRPVPQWEEIGTDEMKLVRRRIKLQGSHNCPRLHDQDVQPLDYLEQIISGFAMIYRLLLTYRDEMIATWLPRFAHDEIRFVARATSSYSIFFTESFHPNMLRHALKRERFLDYLWIAVSSQPSLARLIPTERADLLQGDIPLFTSYPESRDVWTSRGECLPNFFEQSSLEQVRQRLQSLSEEELRRQSWIIRASFAQLASQRETATPAARVGPSRLAALPVSREYLLAQACAIGDRLYTSALWDGKYADWIGLTRLFENTWYIAPAGLDLQSGLPGMILFLSYLGLISGKMRYTDLAQAGLKTLRIMLHQSQLDQTGIGAFTGLSSCLYLFTHLATLWNDPSFLKEAKGLVPQLASQVTRDERFDLIDGAAGSIAVLLNLSTIARSDQTVQLAIACGDHLLAHAQPLSEGLGWKGQGQDVPRSGFAHGTAGIAWSLFKLAEFSGEVRFRQAAEAALIYECSLFSPEQHCWKHRRQQSHRVTAQDSQEADVARQARSAMSWSHGIPGIALGRLISLPYQDHAAIRLELDIALSTTITECFGYGHAQVGPNHSLAHGDCGNLEVVLLAAQTLRTAQLHHHVERLTAQIGENIQQHRWITGVPLNLETPGLLFGLAGIGYQCLRLAEPERVPSALTLAPPIENQTPLTPL